MNDVFTALADPTRRSILDRLRNEGPRSIKELAEPLDITRQAVTKHLDVLEGAGLVRKEIRGRERVCRLVADPLQVVDAWIAEYAAAWDERLERFRAYVDGMDPGGAGAAGTGGEAAAQQREEEDGG